MSENTLYHAFNESVVTYASNTATATLHDGSYHDETYDVLHDHIRRTITVFRDADLKKGDTLAIMLDNSPLWVTVDLAAAALGIIVVPIHTTYAASNIGYIIKHAEAKVLVIDAKYLDHNVECIETLQLQRIYTDGKSHYSPDNVLELNAVLKSAQASDANMEVSSDDVHTIVYTSGTTGKPKGVMLTHYNLLSNIAAAKEVISILPTDRFFSFLPLSHIFERTAGYYIPLMSGAAIYYATSTKKIVEEIAIAKPTVLVSVPRIFERVHDKVLEKLHQNTSKKKLFFKAMDLARKNKNGSLSVLEKIQYKLLDAVALKKVRNLFGGSLRLAVSGGASLSTKIAKFYESVGIPILEGYGLSETSPIIAVNTLEHMKHGAVGKILDIVDIKISSDKEIMVKGPSVMKGYHNDVEQTKAVIDAEGFFHTGDMGHLDNEGFLTIIGRIKELIILSTGKNIAPEPIESALNFSEYIEQSMVYGDKQKHLSVFIVPNFESLKLWCTEHGITYSLPDTLSNSEVLNLYQTELDRVLSHMSGIEQVKQFKLLAKEFSQEDDTLTPTMKLKRRRIEESYIKESH